MKHIAIIYHSADFDGQFSNFVCRYQLNLRHPEAHIHSYGWNYGQPVPAVQALDAQAESLGAEFDWVSYDAIYIVDLSVDELMTRPELRDKIVWIDHHKSAIEKWDVTPSDADPEPQCFAGLRIDGVAACRLCWQWFTNHDLAPEVIRMNAMQRTLNEPQILQLIGEYDVWDKRDWRAEALQFGLKTVDIEHLTALAYEDFKHNDRFSISGTFSQYASVGRTIQRYCEIQYEKHARAHAHDVQLHGLRFVALNIGAPGGSALVQPAADFNRHDALMAYRFNGKHWVISLYHMKGKEHYDLSTIASKFPGGGGHRGACGFSVDHVQFIHLMVGGFAS